LLVNVRDGPLLGPPRVLPLAQCEVPKEGKLSTVMVQGPDLVLEGVEPVLIGEKHSPNRAAELRGTG